MKIVGIIQARMSSTRLPGKILMDLCGKPMLLQLVERISASKHLNKVIVATSDQSDDDVVESFANAHFIELYRGSLTDVLSRFYCCAKEAGADAIVRFTGDNPLVDPLLIDEGIEWFLTHQDYAYVGYRKGLPVGVSIEIFSFQALEKAYLEATDPECREHVTPYLYRNPKLFRSFTYPLCGEDYSGLRWTVDTEEDFQLIERIYKSLYPENNRFSFRDIIKKYKEHPEWSMVNNRIQQKQVFYKGN